VTETDDDRTVGYAQEYVPQFWEKVGWRLFPQRHTEAPDATAAGIQAKDCLTIRTEVHLSWLDRIRVIVSGRLRVESKTITENRLGGLSTNSGASVRPPKFLERRDDQ
jgi:hypothetical protein